MRAIVFALFITICHNTWSSPSECNSSEPSIRYLGVGAFDIHYQGQRLLTDPFYSPQSFWNIATFTPYTSDLKHIQAVLGSAKHDVNNILIGHGHYDHAADVPAIKEYFADNIKILASTSTMHLLENEIDTSSFVGFNKDNFDQWHTIANGWIRVKAHPSEHAPQALGINLFPEIHDHKVEALPKYIWQWSQGVNITWLVDFLDSPNSTNVKKRIFIQTSASTYPVGVPTITDNIAVDTVYLAAASFDNVDNYPSGLIKQLKPEHIVFIHWENFFKPWYTNADGLTLIDFEKLMSDETLANQTDKAVIATPNTCY